METSADDLAGDLGFVIEQLATLMRSLNTEYPMSRTMSSTLNTLDREGPSRLTALAARERVSQPAMTQLIDRLEAAGLARREPDPTDRRVVWITITDAGRALLVRRRAERTGQLAALLDQLTPEHRELLAAAVPAMRALASTRTADQTVRG